VTEIVGAYDGIRCSEGFLEKNADARLCVTFTIAGEIAAGARLRERATIPAARRGALTTTSPLPSWPMARSGRPPRLSSG